MGNIERARKRFERDARTLAGRSFAADLAARNQDLAALLSSTDEGQALLEWAPSHANDQNLADLLGELSSVLPAASRPRLASVFVGYTDSGELNAEAWSRKGDDAIQISYRFPTALQIYVAVYSDFLRLLDVERSGRHAGAARDVRPEALRILWSEVDDVISGWSERDLFFERIPEQWTVVGSERMAEARRLTRDGAERWALAHELSHHLLGHQGRPDRVASERLKSFMDRHSLRQECGGLNRRQYEEFQADVLATLLCAGYFVDPPAAEARVRRALIAEAASSGMIALTAAAHSNETWRLFADETHPGSLRRVLAVTNASAAIGHEFELIDDDLARHLAAGFQFAASAAAHETYRLSSDERDASDLRGLAADLEQHAAALRGGLMRSRPWEPYERRRAEFERAVETASRPTAPRPSG